MKYYKEIDIKFKKAYIKHLFSIIRGFSFTFIVEEIFDRYVS